MLGGSSALSSHGQNVILAVRIDEAKKLRAFPLSDKWKRFESSETARNIRII